jgi:hypothetical protein
MGRMRQRAAVLLLTGMLVAGCGEDQPDAGSTGEDGQVTPAEAVEQMQIIVVDILRTAVPTKDAVLEEPFTDIPCGGPVGTDSSKIEATLTAAAGGPDAQIDPDESFAAVAEMLVARGYEVIEPEDDGGEPTMLGTDPAGGGVRLVWRADEETFWLNAGTACLDNPDHGQ